MQHQPLRIAMLAPFGIRPKGTLSARMLPLAQALVERGHTVTISAPPVHNPQDAGQHTIYAGVPVTHLDLPTSPGVPGGLQWIIALLQQALAVRPDVLHLFKPKGYSGLAALLARFTHPRLPLVVDTDDWEGRGGWNDLLPYPRLAKELFAWQEYDLLRRAQAVTVASRTLETQVWGAGVPPERVFYLPNGIRAASLPTSTVRREHSGPTLLLYTRFWEFNVSDLIIALAAIIIHYPTTRLLVIGRGERGEEHDMLRLAARAGIASAIDYRGWIEPAAIPAFLATADIALVPLNDTLINRARCSVKLLELMAAGLPIVAGQVGQVGEYIKHHHSGLLVPPADPAALARAALLLLAHADLRVRLGAAARTAVDAFRWERLVPGVEQAYYYVTFYNQHPPCVSTIPGQ